MRRVNAAGGGGRDEACRSVTVDDFVFDGQC